jgi:hypothetical protein
VDLEKGKRTKEGVGKTMSENHKIARSMGGKDRGKAK